MTRNVYLGGDITRPIRAAAGRTGPAAALALGRANAELRAVVDRTDFGVRSRLLADEITAAQPDLVGLQEVALWRHGPIEVDRPGVPNATGVDYDFLALLLDALGRRGIGYRAASTQVTADVEGPAFADDPRTDPPAQTRDVRLTLRDVVLIRVDSGWAVRASGGGTYRPRVTLNLGGVPYAIVRGYSWVDVAQGSTGFRFITTHLESQSADLALAQAGELRAVTERETQPTVVACDCNSDPLSAGVRPGQTAPANAAYRRLTAGDGFADAWLGPQPPSGPTAGLSETVDDPPPADLDARLDLVLTRDGAATGLRAVHAEVTGDEPGDRDQATGLWPSDHAGVVADLDLGPR